MNKRLAWAAAAILGAALTGILGCSKDSSNPYGGSSGSSSPPPPNTVVMMNIAFNPGTLTVSKGTTVTWQNNDGITHTSTSDNGVWDTGNIAGGASKTVTFPTAGTFKYHCAIHGPSMSGTIVVL
ncbi:MAG: cupredoxin domain-containing protein [Bacteroidota bacterium]